MSLPSPDIGSRAGDRTECLAVDPVHPEPDRIARAAAVLRAGGLVAFPTETVYGLGADVRDPVAVARLYAAKGRPAWNPVIAHVASVDAARALAATWPPVAERLARAFWPGPLTLVVPRHPDVPDAATAGLDAIGIRMPDHPVALALIRAAGCPVAAPSANRFTELSPTTAQHVLRSLGGRVPLVLDGGPCAVGLESTVVDCTGPAPRILRPGAIGVAALAAAAGVPVEVAPPRAVAATGGATAPQLSPGQADRHYAPRADAWLFDADDAGAAARGAADAVARRPAAGPVGALLLRSAPPLPPGAIVERMPADAAAYARRLYAALHALDEAGCALVLIERPPDAPGWEAVHDRLARAAVPGGAPRIAATG
jgi:L-threonylcarbamoyladenylate synthase